MSTTELDDLCTAMKALSMRRENLYRALTIHPPGSRAWVQNSREIDSINESMQSLEDQRTQIREEMTDASAARAS
jgi:hypothetical protein